MRIPSSVEDGVRGGGCCSFNKTTGEPAATVVAALSASVRTTPNPSSAKEGSYFTLECFMSQMMKEIFEQPLALKRTFAAERDHARAFADFARKQKFRLVVLVARGTSDNAAVFGRYLIELATGIPVSLCAPSIHTLYHAHMDFRQTLVVGISQSGEGTDINLVLESAKRQGAYTLAITNEARSTMAALADDVFVGRAGKQRSVAATKTYTSQLMLLYMLAASVSSQVTLSDVSEIPHRVEATLKLAPEIKEMVERYRYMRRCVVVARGINYANAFEMALKLMETCYVVAERFSAADFLHGPIAMIERDFPALVFNPPGKTFREHAEIDRAPAGAEGRYAGVHLHEGTRSRRLTGDSDSGSCARDLHAHPVHRAGADLCCISR